MIGLTPTMIVDFRSVNDPLGALRQVRKRESQALDQHSRSEGWFHVSSAAPDLSISLNSTSAGDGTPIEALASMKNVKSKDGSEEPPAAGGRRYGKADFHDNRWLNKTHASTTHPEARFFKKSKDEEAKLCFMRHELMESRHGLPRRNGRSQRQRSRPIAR
ncbi:hypothetical protein [Hoeflea sp.]|uniref:hypothetical protein n=1 Tax=Hoeflea sp. TaxID=1940281 RepID=UPI003A959979